MNYKILKLVILIDKCFMLYQSWKKSLRSSVPPISTTRIITCHLDSIDKILLIPVPDLPIGSIGWSLGPIKCRGPPAKVYNIFNTVIGLSYLCCHNSSVIVLTQLHSISEYYRILNASHHLRIYWNWLSTLPPSSSHEGGEGPHKWNSLGPLFI